MAGNGTTCANNGYLLAGTTKAKSTCKDILSKGSIAKCAKSIRDVHELSKSCIVVKSKEKMNLSAAKGMGRCDGLSATQLAAEQSLCGRAGSVNKV